MNNQLTKSVDVIIATPGRQMEAPYVKSLIQTTNYLHEAGISYYYANQYSPRVDAAREATAMDSTFLDITSNSPLGGKIKYKKIFWIDSDMEWTPMDFISIYDSPHEIVSGVYLNSEGTPMFNLHPDDMVGNENSNDQVVAKIREKLSGGKAFEISAAGFGFIAMKYGVFEAMSRPWFATQFTEVQDADGRKHAIPYGEDFSWCIAASRHGFKIHLDPNVSLTHHKTVAIKING